VHSWVLNPGGVVGLVPATSSTTTVVRLNDTIPFFVTVVVSTVSDMVAFDFITLPVEAKRPCKHAANGQPPAYVIRPLVLAVTAVTFTD
jgi:hypothetical protein